MEFLQTQPLWSVVLMLRGQTEEDFTCLSSPVAAKGGTECPQLTDLGRLHIFFFKEKRSDQTEKVV